MNRPNKGSSALIRDLGCAGRKYGPLWDNPEYVMECLCRYLRDEDHGGLMGQKVSAAGFVLAYDHPHAGTGEEHQAISRLIELGHGGSIIAPPKWAQDSEDYDDSEAAQIAIEKSRAESSET